MDLVIHLNIKHFGYLFDSMINALSSTYAQEFLNVSSRNKYVRSSVGDFVFSTTCANEQDLKNVFGNGELLYEIGGERICAPNTFWKKHGEYVLRGANSNVVFNNSTTSIQSNNDNITIPLANHGHTLLSHNHGNIKAKASIDSGKWVVSISAGKKTGDDETSKHHRYALNGTTDGTVTVKAKASGSLGDDNNFSCTEVGTNDTVTTSKIQPTFYCWVWERIG